MIKPDSSVQNVVDKVEQLLLANKGARRRLTSGGRLQIDRPQPFLSVYRHRNNPPDQATEQLVSHFASALIAHEQDEVAELVEMIARRGSEAFGGFLVIEIWAGPQPESGATPKFVVYGPKTTAHIPLVESLQRELCGIDAAGQQSKVLARRGPSPAPPGFDPLLSEQQARDLNCVCFGLEIPPVYRNPKTGNAWPQILRAVRRDLTLAARRFVYHFLHTQTRLRPKHYNAIGSRTVAKAVWKVDEGLAKVADSFDFLLQVTPVNSPEAWQAFQRSKYQRPPMLQYRPLPVDTAVLKRALYSVPIENVDDPALYQLFREKQDELDRQITLLSDMNTPRFLQGSLQLFGGVEDDLYRLACEMLEKLPPNVREKPDGPALDANAFAKRARAEVRAFRKQCPQIKARVEVRDDVHTGLMVSQGSLLIGAGTMIPASRAEALIQHEVGTHVLTYWNGRVQPFRQLYSGLAGYDPLQEGIAVLAEAFVGGLSRPRKRLLHGRVVGARLMIQGATFVETFHELHRSWGFEAHTAFTITLRLYRGGGLTKDAVYVRGIAQLLDYLRDGGTLEPLLIGKMAMNHVPLIQELQARKILVPPAIKPGYLDSPQFLRQLEHIRTGLTLFQLLRDKSTRRR